LLQMTNEVLCNSLGLERGACVRLERRVTQPLPAQLVSDALKLRGG
jgi:hypothetical protein